MGPRRQPRPDRGASACRRFCGSGWGERLRAARGEHVTDGKEPCADGAGARHTCRGRPRTKTDAREPPEDDGPAPTPTSRSRRARSALRRGRRARRRRACGSSPRSYKVPLDFEPETRWPRRQYVRDARAELREKPETLDLLAGVDRRVPRRGHASRVRRDTGSARATTTGGGSISRTCTLHSIRSAWPARRSCSARPRDGTRSLRPSGRARALERSASRRSGEIDEDEYYAPTTRFDVVEIAVDALRARMRPTGTAT